MTSTAIYEKRDGALHLLPGSTLPDALREHLEAHPIALDSDLFVAIAARLGAEMTVKLNNHDKIPGAKDAGFKWGYFTPRMHPDTGDVVGVWAKYE